jgi:16S rRNA (adenine1518-N6/adenine1519-N6)-dimethyltransferase
MLDKILEQYQITPDSELGQNFLQDDNVMRQQLAAAELSVSDTVLEIGPGPGLLTQALAQAVRKVVAIEADLQFKSRLEELTGRLGNIELIWGDATHVAWPDFDRLVANLPYKVALPVIFQLLEQKFKSAVVMVQDKMAVRLLASPGTDKYGRVSVTVQRLAEIELVAKVPATAFYPAPVTGSALIKLVPKAHIDEVSDTRYFRQMLDYLFFYKEWELGRALAKVGFNAEALNQQGLAASQQIWKLTTAELVELCEICYQQPVAFPEISNEMKRKRQKLLKQL